MGPEIALLCKTMDPAEIGRRLRAARLAAGLTQAQLADGIASTAYLSRVEDGQRRPSIRILERVAMRLATSVDELFSDQDEINEWRLTVDHAELSLAVGDATSALAAARRVIDEAAEHPGIRRAAEQVLAGALEATGDLDGAILILEKLAAAPHASSGWLRVLIALSRCYKEQGDLTRAISVGEQAVPEIESLGLAGLTESIQLAVTVAHAYTQRGDLSQALRICRQAISDAEAVDSAIGKASAYWNASLIETRRGQHEAALNLARRALAVFEVGEDSRNLGRLRTQVAVLQLRVDPPDAEGALETLRKAERELAWSAASAVDKADHHLVLARAHHLLGADDVALAELENSQALADGVAPVIAAHAAVLRGEMAAAAGDVALARDCYLTAVRHLSSVGADRDAAQLWFELAGLLDELGERDQALDAYRCSAAAAGVAGRASIRSASLR